VALPHPRPRGKRLHAAREIRRERGHASRADGTGADRHVADIDGTVNGTAYTPIATALANAKSATVPATNAGGQTYTAYRVSAVGANGTGSAVFTRAPVAPAAPSALTATPANSNATPRRVTVRWTDNSTNETGFTVQYSRQLTGGANPTWGAWVSATAAAANATSQQITVPSTGTYQFRMQSFNAAGSSAYAGPVTAVVLR
jgi:hypothetical protein